MSAYSDACNREHTLVFEALTAASGRSAEDVQGCGCMTQLTFDASGRATEVLLTQRGFITISASEFASRLDADIVTAAADHIRLRR